VSVSTIIRQAMADGLCAGLELEEGIGFPPAQGKPNTVFVASANGPTAIDYRPGPGTPASWCNPARYYRAVFLAGPADWQDAFEWLDDMAERVQSVCAANPTLDGLVNSWAVSAISEHQLYGDVPSIEVTFGPLVAIPQEQ